MVNGSVRVREGDNVTEREVIGLMDNSGNSDAPHLHFQVVTDNPTVLGGEGYPIVYRSFNVTDRLDEENVTGTNAPILQENRIISDLVQILR